MLTRQQIGLLAFQQIKDDLKNRGAKLNKLPPDYPISRRTAYNIKKGNFAIETIRKIPGFPIVVEWFQITK